jgi:hypothetical protein
MHERGVILGPSLEEMGVKWGSVGSTTIAGWMRRRRVEGGATVVSDEEEALGLGGWR